MSNKHIFSKDLVILIRNIQGKVIEKPLRELIKISVKNYLYKIKDTSNVTNLYKILLEETEQPLLDIIMQHTRGNQTKAALIMGINRGTLRKKLKKYRMG